MSLLEITLEYRVLIGISAMVLLFSSFLIAFISNQRKKLQYHKSLQALHEEQKEILMRQNLFLEQGVKERTTELFQQKEALEKALKDLKSTQLQLVHREKMASLGELTAGIAHEIQNPLNFVNNFSEVNAELLLEIKDQIDQESLPENSRRSIDSTIDDVIQNLQKINLHGRRADAIVKSMLQHTRMQKAEKEFADINTLTDECLKLSYHSFRAKDKSFNVTIKTEYELGMSQINIIAQEMARVLINLFNNAFYSVNEKMKTKLPGYEPTIWVITKKVMHTIEIKIRDNGTGISSKIIDKIYNPFFTTKPTGEGTGLGLSMSYEIIKAHQGELRVESVEGEFAEFTIQLACET